MIRRHSRDRDAARTIAGDAIHSGAFEIFPHSRHLPEQYVLDRNYSQKHPERKSQRSLMLFPNSLQALNANIPPSAIWLELSHATFSTSVKTPRFTTTVSETEPLRDDGNVESAVRNVTYCTVSLEKIRSNVQPKATWTLFSQ